MNAAHNWMDSRAKFIGQNRTSRSFGGQDDASAPKVVALRRLDAFMAQQLACRLLAALVAGVICRLRPEVVKPKFFDRTGKVGVDLCRRFSCHDELVAQRRCGQPLAPFIDEKRSDNDLVGFFA